MNLNYQELAKDMLAINELINDVPAEVDIEKEQHNTIDIAFEFDKAIDDSKNNPKEHYDYFLKKKYNNLDEMTRFCCQTFVMVQKLMTGMNNFMDFKVCDMLNNKEDDTNLENYQNNIKLLKDSIPKMPCFEKTKKINKKTQTWTITTSTDNIPLPVKRRSTVETVSKSGIQSDKNIVMIDKTKIDLKRRSLDDFQGFQGFQGIQEIKTPKLLPDSVYKMGSPIIVNRKLPNSSTQTNGSFVGMYSPSIVRSKLLQKTLVSPELTSSKLSDSLVFINSTNSQKNVLYPAKSMVMTNIPDLSMKKSDRDSQVMQNDSVFPKYLEKKEQGFDSTIHLKSPIISIKDAAEKSQNNGAMPNLNEIVWNQRKTKKKNFNRESYQATPTMFKASSLSNRTSMASMSSGFQGDVLAKLSKNQSVIVEEKEEKEKVRHTTSIIELKALTEL